jgi:DNA-directed RNA polymerase specialized sigma24 family protein
VRSLDFLSEMAKERSDGGGGSALPAEKVMLGVLALLAADRDERVEKASPRKSELVLADAGFTWQEIAGLTGKNPEAVRSLLRRASGKKGGSA